MQWMHTATCLLVLLTGCSTSPMSTGTSSTSTGGSTGGGGTTPPAVPSCAPAPGSTARPSDTGRAACLYVTVPSPLAGNPSTSQLLGFSATASGAVDPLIATTLPTDMRTMAVTTDTAGAVYVGSYNRVTYASGTVTMYGVQYSNNLNSVSVTRSFTPLYLDGTEVPPMVLGVDAALQPYVYSNILTVYPANASGRLAPVASASRSTTNLQDYIYSLAFDGSNNLYVPQVQSTGRVATVSVFALPITGTSKPTRVLAPNSTLSTITGAAVDNTGRMYVGGATLTGTAAIAVFAAGATGDATPLRVIAGASTGLAQPVSVVVDGLQTVYALSGGAIRVFQAAASGNVAPDAVLTSSGLDTAVGIAVY